jgi:predicted XRE-type DNA-binding protein
VKKQNINHFPAYIKFNNCIFNDKLYHSNIPTHIDVNESRFEKNADKVEHFIEDALKNMLKSFNVMRKDEKVDDIQACASEYEV